MKRCNSNTTVVLQVENQETDSSRDEWHEEDGTVNTHETYKSTTFRMYAFDTDVLPSTCYFTNFYPFTFFLLSNSCSLFSLGFFPAHYFYSYTRGTPRYTYRIILSFWPLSSCFFQCITSNCFVDRHSNKTSTVRQSMVTEHVGVQLYYIQYAFDAGCTQNTIIISSAVKSMQATLKSTNPHL